MVKQVLHQPALDLYTVFVPPKGGHQLNIGEGMAETARKARAEFSARGGVWRYPGRVSNIMGMVGPPVAQLGFTMRARLSLPEGSTTGAVFASGGKLGGIALYIRDNRPVFTLNTICLLYTSRCV